MPAARGGGTVARLDDDIHARLQHSAAAETFAHQPFDRVASHGLPCDAFAHGQAEARDIMIGWLHVQREQRVTDTAAVAQGAGEIFAVPDALVSAQARAWRVVA